MRATAMLLLLVCLTGACATYKRQEVPFKPPAAYTNVKNLDGAELAAVGYAEEEAAKQAFGFNIRKAGLLPVQVIIDNAGPQPLEIVPEQTFLLDAEGNYWRLLDRGTAYERLEQSTEYARIASGAGRRSVIGVAGGALVGAAIGILTGENVAEAAGTGAAVGGAGGAVLGGVEAGTEGPSMITQDLAAKQLQNKAVDPKSLAMGFLFFPGEAPSAGELRLQVRQMESGEVHTLLFDLDGLPAAP